MKSRIGFCYELETLTTLNCNLCLRSQNVYDPYQPYIRHWERGTRAKIDILATVFFYLSNNRWESIQFLFYVNTFEDDWFTRNKWAELQHLKEQIEFSDKKWEMRGREKRLKMLQFLFIYFWITTIEIQMKTKIHQILEKAKNLGWFPRQALREQKGDCITIVLTLNSILSIFT